MSERHTPSHAAATAVPRAAVLSTAAAAVGAGAAETDALESPLDKLPADEYEAGRQICRELIKDGPAGLERLFSMVTEPGCESGVKPRYASSRRRSRATNRPTASSTSPCALPGAINEQPA